MDYRYRVSSILGYTSWTISRYSICRYRAWWSSTFLSGIWGIPGTILALPLFGIFRIILSQFESTKPLATLMSSSVDEKVGRFKKLADSK